MCIDGKHCGSWFIDYHTPGTAGPSLNPKLSTLTSVMNEWCNVFKDLRNEESRRKLGIKNQANPTDTAGNSWWTIKECCRVECCNAVFWGGFFEENQPSFTLNRLRRCDEAEQPTCRRRPGLNNILWQMLCTAWREQRGGGGLNWAPLWPLNYEMLHLQPPLNSPTTPAATQSG